MLLVPTAWLEVLEEMPSAVVEVALCFIAIVMLILQSLASLAAYTSRTESPGKIPKSKLPSVPAERRYPWALHKMTRSSDYEKHHSDCILGRLPRFHGKW